jgi:fumarate reductase subunit C
MAPPRPGATRTAPPQAPDGWYRQPRMRSYLLFDATGAVYLLLGFLALRAVWALGSGAPAWQAVLASFANPLYLAFHALSLAAVVFVGVRFFRLFPKAQPPRIGPAKPPPRPLIQAGLYAAWIGVTLLFVAILAGGLF